MGVGTSFAYLFIGRAASKMEKEDAKKFMLNSLVLTRMGHIGITLLVLSGLYLATPYFAHILDYPLFIAKLSLVLILIILITVNSINARKFKNGDVTKAKVMRMIGTISFFVALAIITLAVLNFK